MASRLPLVQVAGQIQQLQAGDTCPPSGSAGGDLSGTYPSPTVASIAAAVNLGGVLTASYTGPTVCNDYDPPITGITILQVSSAIAVTITGLVGGTAGRFLIFENVGSTNWGVISDDGTDSTPANRFLTPSNAGILLIPGQSVLLLYDGAVSRWRTLTGVGTPVGNTGGDLAGTYPFPTIARVSGKFYWNGFLSAAISSSQNNYNPTGIGTCNGILFTPSANVNITGIKTAGVLLIANQYLTLLNLSPTYSITFPHQSSSSTPSARFSCPNTQPFVLGPNCGCGLIWSNSTWLIIAAPLAVGTVASTVAAGDDSRLSNSRAPTGPAGGNLAGTYPNPSVIGLTGPLLLAQIAPGVSASPQNDWTPSGIATAVLVISVCFQTTRFTGMLAGVPTQMMFLYNSPVGGSFVITLGHQDTGSAANNRFTCPSAVDYVLQSGHGVWMFYDVNQKWIVSVP
jgi:hypothetical protein